MSMTTQQRGAENVAYETKVLLIALSEIIRKAESLEEVYETVQKMANAEGVIIEPYEKPQIK